MYLTPCPFCAGDPEFKNSGSPPDVMYPHSWWIECRCGIQTARENGTSNSPETGTVNLEAEAKAKLTERWNTRRKRCDKCKEVSEFGNVFGERFCETHAKERIDELTKHDNEPHMIWAKQNATMRSGRTQ